MSFYLILFAQASACQLRRLARYPLLSQKAAAAEQQTICANSAINARLR